MPLRRSAPLPRGLPPQTESAGPQEAIPAAAGSGQKPGVSGLDSDAADAWSVRG